MMTNQVLPSSISRQLLLLPASMTNSQISISNNNATAAAAQRPGSSQQSLTPHKKKQKRDEKHSLAPNATEDPYA